MWNVEMPGLNGPFFWIVSVVLITAALCVGCSDSVSVDDFVYRCDPAGNDCASGYECLKAGTEYVCGQRASCTQVCATDWACVNGECRCFESCDGRECGDDGCGGSCGTCGDREWCDGGKCVDDCGSWKCGTSPNGLACGTCPGLPTVWCNAGKCVDDCESLECGESPNLAISCGTCQNGWWCDSGTCKDDCAGLECGESPNVGVTCGTCRNGWWCDSGTCKDDCAGLECGESPNVGVTCGTCQNGWWCDSGTCKDDCAGLECGESPNVGVTCGTCQNGWWCDSGICKDDCAGLECGESPNVGVTCGTCQDDCWCNSGTCEEDDCGTKECGTGTHGGVCGTCQNGWWCDSGTCKGDCGPRNCGTDSEGNSCGTCQNGWWCDSGTCKDDCVTKECGAGAHGAVCGECGSGMMCNGSGKCILGTMVSIPGGTFQMGSDDALSSEYPVHSVTVKSFEMSRTEVTVRQYKACVDAGVCSAPGNSSGCTWGVSGKADRPVNCVDWNQATAYAMWAGGRLPTEAEWEYAARAGTTGDRYGNIDDIAWYSGNSSGETRSVGLLDPNAFGLYDMLGNVWEWCQDWYHDSFKGAPTDGSAWESPSGSSRVRRGGSWDFDAGLVGAGKRFYSAPGCRSASIGFRVSRSAP